MAKKTRLPDDFEVTQHMIELAKAKGWPDPRSEVEAFKDYHLAHGSLMLDWQACFRTWLRNCSRFNKGHPAIVSKPPPEPKGMMFGWLKAGTPSPTEDERRENQKRLNEIITGLAARKGIK